MVSSSPSSQLTAEPDCIYVSAPNELDEKHPSGADAVPHEHAKRDFGVVKAMVTGEGSN